MKVATAAQLRRDILMLRNSALTAARPSSAAEPLSLTPPPEGRAGRHHWGVCGRSIPTRSYSGGTARVTKWAPRRPSQCHFSCLRPIRLGIGRRAECRG
jgi:hypothetical protein